MPVSTIVFRGRGSRLVSCRRLRSRTNDHPFQRAYRRSTVSSLRGSDVRHGTVVSARCMRLSSWLPWPAGRQGHKATHALRVVATIPWMVQRPAAGTRKRGRRTTRGSSRQVARTDRVQRKLRATAIRSGCRPARTCGMRWFRLD
jgi:hypothetical protein